jgi:aminoglycoside phosphotransferase (APT) family kinase protein
MTRIPARINPTADHVQRVVTSQFPEYADLHVRDVEFSGWDNRTFRLGEELSVRIPSAEWYVAQVEKEQTWLPKLAPLLPLPVPAPVAIGSPTPEIPWPWSINRWLPGEPLATASIHDPEQLATDLAEFLNALYAVEATDGPVAGEQSFFRGCPPAAYDDQTRETIAKLADVIDGAAALAIWEDANSSEWTGQPVWFHGDVAVGNLLVENGHLAAVIDFGTSGVGDPACDTVFAWTWLTGTARQIFAQKLNVSPDCWVRGRGWALWKCLITLADDQNMTLPGAEEQRRILREILADPILPA